MLQHVSTQEGTLEELTDTTISCKVGMKVKEMYKYCP